MKRVILAGLVYIGGCGVFSSLDSRGYGIGISTTEVSSGYFSSLHILFYPASDIASISLNWARPLNFSFITIAPSVGLEALRIRRNDEGRWYGIGGVLAVELIPSVMFDRTSNAGEGDFLWIYMRPYSAWGFDFLSASAYRRYGVEVGFRVRMVYSW